MPIYKNTSNIKQKVSGVVFEPNEEKTLDCFLYDKDLELLSNDPPPEVITHSGTFELMTGETENIILSNTQEIMMELAIQAPDGGVKVYHNSTDNKAIEFEGVYQDQLSSKFLQKIIIEATEDNVKGSYFVKRIG